MQLYFVRHGESEANVRQIFSNSDRDPVFGLTDVGRAQLEDLAGRLAGVRFAAFYCSPVLRARQSADIVSARLGIDYVITPAIAEYDVRHIPLHAANHPVKRHLRSGRRTRDGPHECRDRRAARTRVGVCAMGYA